MDGRALFRDRRDAGRRLASQLAHLRGARGLLVLALPRGGVPVGFEVARALGAPLEVLLVRKLGVPGRSEVAMGAIASGGLRVIDAELVERLGISRGEIAAVEAHERRELERRERSYREGRPPPGIAGRTVVLVDDGVATGSTMKAAIGALREERPAAIVVAVPVAPTSTLRELEALADATVCVAAPEPFYAVGAFYVDFEATSDEEVRSLLDLASSDRPDPVGAGPAAARG